MNWEDIIGQSALKEQLQTAITNGKVSHAQLFVGDFGQGLLPLALAFARTLFTSENPESASRIDTLNHLDLHFSYPVYTEKNEALSSRKFSEFREMILENPYSDLSDWTERFDTKQKFFISTHEIKEQLEKFSLKSFEKGSKVLIVWGVDKMNTEASNRFLKFLEEPPAGTYIILLAESTDTVLPTILSRVQIYSLQRIEDRALETYLRGKGVEEKTLASVITESQGNLRVAQRLVQSSEMNSQFDQLFAQWVREAFQVAKKPQKLKDIILWARGIASWKLEKQLEFLAFCSDAFRQALLSTYGQSEMVYRPIESLKWENFTPFIHGANIEDILEEISKADYHIRGNANQELIWTDLGIKLSRYMHRKP